MAVEGLVAVQPRMWRGYDDPGLPVGAWIAHTVLVGDGTGGAATITVVFRGANEPASGRFYNVEQVELHDTDAGFKNGTWSVVGFERVGTFQIGQRVWKFQLEAGAFASSSMANRTGNIPMPLFLGQSSRFAGLPSTIEVTIANINVNVFSCTLQGYIWEPRSVMAEGGLRRPLDSLYG